jgi:integrase
MRKGEIISLKWNNIDFENHLITLEHTNTKSKKTRRIAINPDLRKIVLEQKLKSGGSEYVFLNSDGKPYLRHDSLNRVFYRVLRDAKIERLRFHDLRHTFATRLIERGKGIENVSILLGHSDRNITRRYSHPSDSLREAVGVLKLPDLDSITDKSTDTNVNNN